MWPEADDVRFARDLAAHNCWIRHPAIKTSLTFRLDCSAQERFIMPRLATYPVTVLIPRHGTVRDARAEQRCGSCGWMCQKPRCFSECIRESVHPGNHFCGGGHTY
jgi:hypothetical protein